MTLVKPSIPAGIPPVTIRLNPGKKPPSWLGDWPRVPWCDLGVVLPERRDFTRDPAFHQGRYYVQEAASMIIYHAAKALTAGLEPLKALDACAAPGGKTTALADALPQGSTILANEFDPKRAQALIENVVRHGTNFITTAIGPAQRFGNYEETFDFILADCPCSGEGMMRKDPVAAAQWTPELVESCAARQKEIFTALYAALKPGGIMIYSTCTFNEAENEQVVTHLLSNTHALNIPIPGINPTWGIQPGHNGILACRFHPDHTLGEGLFVAAITKPGILMPACFKGVAEAIPFKGEKTIPGFPCHSQVMRRDFDLSSVTTCPVDKFTAIDYLRGNAVTITAPRGPVVLTYENLPLGIAKNVGSRANNLYPSQLRIRSTY